MLVLSLSFIVISMMICYFFKNIQLQYFISLLTALIHLIFSFCFFMGWYDPEIFFVSDDSLSRLFLFVVSNVYFWVVLISLSFLKKSSASNGKKYYFLLLNFYLLANTSVILSNSFGVYWVSIEATTLSIAPLIYYYRSEESLEAMWKYLFIASVGVALAFIGILFFSLAAEGAAFESSDLFFSDFVKHAKQLNPIWLKAGFIFIFVGLSTKIGIAPAHSADIDATSNSPSPIAALMSGSLRVTALVGLLRVLQIVQSTPIYGFARILLISGGLLSLFFTFIYMFYPKNFKRLLAYSSVEHLGLIVIGIGIGGLAFIGAFYHIVYNSINKTVLFFSAGNIHQKYQTRKIEKVSDILSFIPITGWLFLISFFAISGIPPFGIFFSELTIFEGILFSDKSWVLGPVLFFLLFIFINMARPLFKMLYRKDHSLALEPGREKLTFIHIAAIALLLLLTLLALFSPDILQKRIFTILNDFGMRL